MFGLVDPADGAIRLWRLVALDAIVMLILCLLFVWHVVSLSLATVGFPVLLVANVLIIGSALRRSSARPMKGRRIRKLEWLVVAAFTANSLVHIVISIREPSIRSLVQAVIGVVLAAFAWFFVYRVRHADSGKRRKGLGSHL